MPKHRFAPIEIGKRYCRLVVLSHAPERDRSGYKCIVRCDCGTEFAVYELSVKAGRTKSCGCLHKDRLRNDLPALKHGGAAGGKVSPEYRVWRSMLTRCRNPRDNHWNRYGGRGITVCERWLQFDNFRADMGQRPGPEYSIDRIDNDGNYELGNCRWATDDEQRMNKSTTFVVELKGQSMTLAAACRSLGIAPPDAHYWRKKLGQTPQELVDMVANTDFLANRRKRRDQ